MRSTVVSSVATLALGGCVTMRTCSVTRLVKEAGTGRVSETTLRMPCAAILIPSGHASQGDLLRVRRS